MSLFDGTKNFIISKPVRLISLFSGYDSQALALKYLGINFEHYKTCEWAVKSIQALKDLHFKDDKTNYSKELNCQYLEELDNRWNFNSKSKLTPLEVKLEWELYHYGISSDYNKQMTIKEICSRTLEWKKQVYNNIRATHNLVNIQQVNASDLEIVNVDKYCYLMTYSFPCQDLSKAGLGKGMEKGSGTRSGMLWEVERILDECENLPQILLMENVPDVIGSKNIQHFAKWLEKLESLGYKCYWRVLNAKDYGIPQNRERCFMVSLLGDYLYEFPQPIKLEGRLKDLLEDSVDEKYYLSDKILSKINIEDNNIKEKIGVDLNSKISKTRDIANTIKARYDCGYENFTPGPTGVIEPKCIGGIGDKNSNNGTQWYLQDRIYDNNIAISVTTGFNPYYVSKEQNLKTKLCNELIASGKVKENDVIRHSYSKSRMDNMYIQNNQFHDCSPTLDTRCDCLGVVVNYIDNPLKNKTQYGWHFEQNVYSKDSKCCRALKASDGSGNIPKLLNNYRIRKLTPKECFRLMGVKDEDFDKLAQNQSNASLYHLAGDSIVVNVLMAIFKNLLKEQL